MGVRVCYLMRLASLIPLVWAWCSVLGTWNFVLKRGTCCWFLGTRYLARSVQDGVQVAWCQKTCFYNDSYLANTLVGFVGLMYVTEITLFLSAWLALYKRSRKKSCVKRLYDHSIICIQRFVLGKYFCVLVLVESCTIPAHNRVTWKGYTIAAHLFYNDSYLANTFVCDCRSAFWVLRLESSGVAIQWDRFHFLHKDVYLCNCALGCFRPARL